MGFPVDAKFFGEKNYALLKRMQDNQDKLSSELMSKMEGKVVSSRRTFKSPQLHKICPKADYIDFNRRLSPLSRILGSDRATGFGQFRKQSE